MISTNEPSITVKRFSGRSEEKEIFKVALDQDIKPIIVYYGIGGIGKTALLESLSHSATKKESTIYASIDFISSDNLSAGKALRSLADQLKRYGKKFPIFDIAYAKYFSKAYPDLKRDKKLPLDEELNYLTSFSAIFDQGILSFLVSTIQKIYDKLQGLGATEELQDRMKKLDDLNYYEIENELPYFFAEDINRINEKTNYIILFFDTFEETDNEKHVPLSYNNSLNWIKNLKQHLPKTLFVVCGRDEFGFENNNQEDFNLEYSRLDVLNEDDSIDYLVKCNISKNIQNDIFKISEGYPLYLALCVEMCEKIHDPKPENFQNIDKKKILDRFIKYLTLQEQETLKILSNANYYDSEIFKLLIKEFATGYPATLIDHFSRYSFIEEKDKRYYINRVIRNSMIDSQSKSLKQEVDLYLFEYYANKMRVSEYDGIELSFLKEAYYHKKNLGDSVALANWFLSVISPYAKHCIEILKQDDSHQVDSMDGVAVKQNDVDDYKQDYTSLEDAYYDTPEGIDEWKLWANQEEDFQREKNNNAALENIKQEKSSMPYEKLLQESMDEINSIAEQIKEDELNTFSALNMYGVFDFLLNSIEELNQYEWNENETMKNFAYELAALSHWIDIDKKQFDLFEKILLSYNDVFDVNQALRRLYANFGENEKLSKLPNFLRKKRT